MRKPLRVHIVPDKFLAYAQEHPITPALLDV